MKLSFSQRMGLKPIRNEIQIESIDDSLRTRLWNALVEIYFQKVVPIWGDYSLHNHENMMILAKRLWHNYFRWRLDDLDIDWRRTYDEIKKYFFSCKWGEVYDFIEFVANNYPDEKVNMDFMEFCNTVLEEEISAYRFVGGKIVQITSETEIKEIEEALESTEPLKGVNTHLNTALALLSDRKKPDYRNSIKESISAIEAFCRIIVEDDRATLGKALNKIEKEGKIVMNPNLKEAFKNLYWYTSDAEGIRHGSPEEPNLSFEDAKFMLLSCSAFVNYLIVKAEKAGIDLKGSM